MNDGVALRCLVRAGNTYAPGSCVAPARTYGSDAVSGSGVNQNSPADLISLWQRLPSWKNFISTQRLTFDTDGLGPMHNRRTSPSQAARKAGVTSGGSLKLSWAETGAAAIRVNAAILKRNIRNPRTDFCLEFELCRKDHAGGGGIRAPVVSATADRTHGHEHCFYGHARHCLRAVFSDVEVA